MPVASSSCGGLLLLRSASWLRLARGGMHGVTMSTAATSTTTTTTTTTLRHSNTVLGARGHNGSVGCGLSFYNPSWTLSSGHGPGSSSFSTLTGAFTSTTTSATTTTTTATTSCTAATKPKNTATLSPHLLSALHPATTVALAWRQSTAGMASFRERKKKYQKAQEKEQRLRRGSGPGANTPTRKEMIATREHMPPRVSPGVIADPWLPLEPADKPSLLSLSTAGWRYAYERFRKRVSATVSVAAVKRSIKGWSAIEFGPEAQALFVRTQDALARGPEGKAELYHLVTDTAYSALTRQFGGQRHTWELVEELERPQVVHVAAFPVEEKSNLYAQITVRFHTRQRLAVYDAAGRVVMGDEVEPRDVLDFVVFERHIAKEPAKSSWQICGKVPYKLPESASAKDL